MLSLYHTFPLVRNRPHCIFRTLRRIRTCTHNFARFSGKPSEQCELFALFEEKQGKKSGNSGKLSEQYRIFEKNRQKNKMCNRCGCFGSVEQQDSVKRIELSENTRIYNISEAVCGPEAQKSLSAFVFQRGKRRGQKNRNFRFSAHMSAENAKKRPLKSGVFGDVFAVRKKFFQKSAQNRQFDLQSGKMCGTIDA